MNFSTLVLFHLLLFFFFLQLWMGDLTVKLVMVLFFSSCFSYGWYFTFVQGFVYLCLIYLQGFTSKQMVNPWKTYVKLSAVLMGSHGLTKGSLAFLNYPAQIMFKSTKVCDKSTWKTQKKKPSYHYFTHFWRKHVCISLKSKLLECVFILFLS